MQLGMEKTTAYFVGRHSASSPGIKTCCVPTVTRPCAPSVGWSALHQHKEAPPRRWPGCARSVPRAGRCGRSLELGSSRECQNRRKRRKCPLLIWEKVTRRKEGLLFINQQGQKRMN
jgi:hypothetical protein